MKTIKLKANKELINDQETIFSTYHLLKMICQSCTQLERMVHFGWMIFHIVI